MVIKLPGGFLFIAFDNPSIERKDHADNVVGEARNPRLQPLLLLHDNSTDEGLLDEVLHVDSSAAQIGTHGSFGHARRVWRQDD